MILHTFEKILKKTILAAVLCAWPAAFAGGVFVTALPRRPVTLDPAYMYDRYSVMAAVNIYEPLVRFGASSYRTGFEPVLAERVPTENNGLISTDGRVYTFPIRKGVKFHDGTEMTPQDVRYSLLRFMLADRIEGPSGLLLNPILGINSTRDKTGRITLDFEEAAGAVRVDGANVVITLKKPFPAFLAVLAAWPCVVSRNWCARHGEWDGAETTWKNYNNRPRENSYLKNHANGTGPFALESFDDTTGQFTLGSHDLYWRAPAPLDQLVFVIEPSELNRQIMLETGDADYAEFGRASVQDLEKFRNVTVKDGLPDYSLGRFIAFSFKVETGSNPMTGSGRLDGTGIPADFFADADVRKGFAYAFDYERYFAEVLRGRGKRLTSPVPRPGSPEKAAYYRDPEKAAARLKTAFEGRLWEKGFRCDAEYPLDDPDAEAVVDILSDSLKALNPRFEVHPRPVSAELFKQDIRAGRAPLFVKTFEPDYPDYYNYAFGLMHSEGLIPRMQRYSNPRADRLCAETLYKDGPARETVFSALDAIYERDIPQLLLYSPVNFKAYRSGLTGMDADWGMWGMHNFPDYYAVVKP
ncbi:MAG: ABC transporter substrate-binding protein [Elusimicrobiaceae bacterium]|nr:ABC transporter substrate-binding protein [Elusimicrobiaceae bacterium]